MNKDESYKTKTAAVYNRYADAFETKLHDNFHTLNIDKAERFIAHLPGKRILDIGAGSGAHAVYFQQQAYDVLCGDYSEAMLALCRQKGLKAEFMDIENLSLPNASFDGIWAYAVLLHVPRNHIPGVVMKLAQLLTKDGVLALSVKEGTGEGFADDSRYPEGQRFFSYFTDEEVRLFFEPYFTLLYAGKTPATQTVPFLHYLYRLK